MNARQAARSLAIRLATGRPLAGILLIAFLVCSGSGVVKPALAAPRAMMDDFAGCSDYRCLAQYPEVIIGTVDSLIGEHNISESSAALMVPLFAVEIDRPIFGTAAGRVDVAIFMDEFTAELPGDEVEVGGRYLFASDVPDDAGVYYGSEGFDVIAVKDEAGANALEAEFRRFREDGETGIPAIDPSPEPCEDVTGPPTIAVEPNRVQPGAVLSIEVTNVVRPEVGIFWRNLRHMIGTGRVGRDCTSSAEVKVPRKAKPGVYRVVVSDARVKKAYEDVVVTRRGAREVDRVRSLGDAPAFTIGDAMWIWSDKRS